MTEYDYSEEGRRRYIATQNRIAKWVHDSESSPQLKSPFSPRSNTGSDATVRQQQYGPSRPSSHRPSTMQFSRGPTSQHSHRTSQASGPPPSRLSSQIYPASQGGSRAPASTVHPSQSISQAPSQRMESSPSHHSSHRSSHHSHHSHRSPTYIISPPPSPHPMSRGMIILPRRGKDVRVVYY